MSIFTILNHAVPTESRSLASVAIWRTVRANVSSEMQQVRGSNGCSRALSDEQIRSVAIDIPACVQRDVQIEDLA